MGDMARKILMLTESGNAEVSEGSTPLTQYPSALPIFSRIKKNSISYIKTQLPLPVYRYKMLENLLSYTQQRFISPVSEVKDE